MPAMAPMTFNFKQTSDEAIVDKLDLFMSLDSGATWQRLGPFDDDGSLETAKSLYEYDNSGETFLSMYTKQSFKIKGSLLNSGNIYQRAIAFGVDPSLVDTSDPTKQTLDLSDLVANPPYFALRAVGKRMDGKYFMHEFARAVVSTESLTEAFKMGELDKLPIEFTALKDELAPLGFKVYRYSVDV